jgi:hypothetical protein
VTADVDEALELLEAFKASGVEGLVVKGATTRYQPGRRDWVKSILLGWACSVGFATPKPARSGREWVLRAGARRVSYTDGAVAAVPASRRRMFRARAPRLVRVVGS